MCWGLRFDADVVQSGGGVSGSGFVAIQPSPSLGPHTHALLEDFALPR